MDLSAPNKPCIGNPPFLPDIPHKNNEKHVLLQSQIYDLPKNGMKLFTEITVVQEVFDITLISAQVKVEDKLIAECRMKIFIKKE